MKKRLILAAIFGCIGIIGGVFVGLYQMETLSEDMVEEIILQLGSIEMLMVVSGLQSGMFAFVSTFFGLIFIEKLGLSIFAGFQKKWIIAALSVGVFSGLFIVLSDSLIFSSLLGEQTSNYQFNIFYFLGGLIYGGVVEELLLRLFVMTGLILIIQTLILRQKDHKQQKPWVYITAITTSALLFGALHLPATALMFDLSVGIVLRALLLNGIPGIAFGYLFWKHDLVHAMIAHAFTHVVMQLILMPIFF